MSKIYLVRHSQTLFNLLYRTQGQCDSPLTALGIEKAENLGKHFRKEKITFDHGFCSTSERTEDTLNYITNNELDYTRLKKLKEINFGSLEGGSDKEIWDKHPDITLKTFNSYFKEFGVEDLEDGKHRMVEAMTDIANSNYDNILVVSHGMIIALFMDYLGDSFYKKFFELKQDNNPFMENCDCAVFEYKDNKFEIIDYIKYEEIGGK